MSGIAKPLNHFTGAITAHASKFVPVDLVRAAEPVDIGATPGGDAASWHIDFFLIGQVQPIRISFTTAALRNTTITNYKTANSVAIAGT